MWINYNKKNSLFSRITMFLQLAMVFQQYAKVSYTLPGTFSNIKVHVFIILSCHLSPTAMSTEVCATQTFVSLSGQNGYIVGQFGGEGSTSGSTRCTFSVEVSDGQRIGLFLYTSVYYIPYVCCSLPRLYSRLSTYIILVQ